MDKLLVAKLANVLMSPILPQPGESAGGIGGLFAGGMMGLMEAVKNLQTILTSGNIGGLIADSATPEALAEMEKILLDAGYTKAGVIDVTAN